ncbi:MAG: bifunctional DNA-formamidopyrimidine glycosylase/DNA-(apurinic or apyrimidinic site) lyase [Thermoguttaceae bacterium]|jgi:formamidopyrimidine-DNA glycosylase
MPELPEVETMCRRIATVVGCRIGNLKRSSSPLQSILIYPRLSVFRRRVKGQTIAAISRLGKRVVLELENGERIVIEPRMTGLILLDNPPDRKHLRLIFELEGGSARQLLFWDQRGLGVVRLLSPGEFRKELGPERIGPDALRITPEILRKRLVGSRRAIKVALLDQHAIAGIGNLYASEILHRAGVHPAKPCNELKPRHWAAIHAAMRKVLQEAIRHQGSTLRDGTYRVTRDEPGNYQDKHRVYQRAGKPCLQCGAAEIVRIVQAQRSTFFCPVCQR